MYSHSSDKEVAMSEKKEQEKPLAPSTHRFDPEDNDDPPNFTTHRCIKWFGCSIAIFLLLVMIVLILMFTVFRVKDPVLKMNSTTIEGLDAVNITSDLRPGLNATLTVDFSIKNPNVASFKFNETTTYVYYDGSVIGAGQVLSGLIRARTTLRTNLSIEIMVDKILQVQRLNNDLSIGILPFSSDTRVRGHVKITNAIQRDSTVKMNCTMNVNLSSHEIQDRNCRSRVSL